MSRVPASGVMTWNDIQNSFGGSNPIFINEYYNSGPLVSPSNINANIPTSGQIEATDFRGADGFSGTTCTFSIGTTGGKLVQNGYSESMIGIAAIGSNLGTAFTSGSGVKLNMFRISTFGGNAIVISTSSVVSNATITLSNMEGKVITFSGALNTTRTIPAPTNGDAGQPSECPTNYGGSGTTGVNPPQAISYGLIGSGNNEAAINFPTSGTQNISIA